jgi:hypothetical protein
MKAYKAAELLNQLAKILKEAPNEEIEMLRIGATKVRELSKDEMALNVSTLLALSRIKKSTWKEFINDNNWPIEVKDRDSSRNLIGKVFQHLETHPDALKDFQRKTNERSGRVSTELMNALSSLLDK